MLRRLAVAVAVAAVTLGVAARPSVLRPQPTAAPVTQERPVITFTTGLRQQADAKGRIRLRVPTGLELEPEASFRGEVVGEPAADLGLRLRRTGDVVEVRLPPGAGGELTLTPTTSRTWPSWRLGSVVVQVSTDPADGFPAGPATVAGTGTIGLGPVTARPGEATAVDLPERTALAEATAGPVEGALVEAPTAGSAPPAVTPVPVEVTGSRFVLTVPAQLPVDAYPVTRAVPDVRLVWPGRGGLTSVAVTGPLAVTRHLVDRPGLARPAADGSLEFVLPDAAGALRAVRFGRAGDVPLVGDWDGDGTPALGAYRPSTGTFLLASSLADGGGTITEVAVGRPGDLPVTGRFNPASKVRTVGVYRPATSEFFLAATNTTGGGVTSFRFGRPGDLPVAGHWHEADAPDTVALYRPATATGPGTFLLASANVTGGGTVVTRTFGAAGDVPLTGDFNGDGRDDPAVRRPATATFHVGASMGALDPRTSLTLGRVADRVFAWTPSP